MPSFSNFTRGLKLEKHNLLSLGSSMLFHLQISPLLGFYALDSFDLLPLKRVFFDIIPKGEVDISSYVRVINFFNFVLFNSLKNLLVEVFGKSMVKLLKHLDLLTLGLVNLLLHLLFLALVVLH